ncbi:hypothetical protein ACWGCW_28785, partial [Streptomyces sp. NPDC054933]
VTAARRGPRRAGVTQVEAEPRATQPGAHTTPQKASRDSAPAPDPPPPGVGGGAGPHHGILPYGDNRELRVRMQARAASPDVRTPARGTAEDAGRWPGTAAIQP